MNPRHLLVLLGGKIAGEISRDQNRLAFAYDPDWLESDVAMPLSLSLPLEAAQHASRTLEAFIWGLLPDNERVLDKWAKQFQVSARNPFALIANVGEDCAGAVQFVRRERFATSSFEASKVTWLTEEGVAERLRALRRDEGATRLPRDTGQFSLPGAQAKTALLLRNGRWGVPSGRTPTTHILKPPSDELDGHAENEHFCLCLARALNLPAASSRVQRFGDEVAIIVERYDRHVTERGVLRLHQEDMCQAFGMFPTAKYQNEGGPAPSDIANLLRNHSSRPDEDVETFVHALIFNWLIAGTDAHAKNYSLLHAPGSRVRLAPLYDIASALPYEQLVERKLKLAMKVGGAYRLSSIGVRQWQRAEQELGFQSGRLVRRAQDLARGLIELVPVMAEQMRDERLHHPIIGRLQTALTQRAERCLRDLNA